mmetsp:Transcript_91352/g.200132  ORF Transcript_91352/g.200132 Transcript_91352/m.200132 type:complete len:471 (+) Transcript_91352:78-1490(+)
MAEDKFSFKHVFTSANPGLLDDFYTVDKKLLGEGSYGKVQMGRHKATGAQRAIKSIDIAKIRDKDRFKQETDIQMNLDHPNIVKLYETFIDARRVYLVMELCTGGELFDRIVEEADKHEGSAFGEKDVARYMQQILGAMRYLHSKSYAHRDIKPENFLLQNRTREAEIKVIDFGLAKAYTPGELMKTKAGTPYYVSPQVLSGKGYDEKCDIWSCGVICYILVCGYPPFYGDTDLDILNRVKGGSFDFPSPDWDQNSRELKDFISKMLTFDSAKRPSAEDLFSHPWLVNSFATTDRLIKFDKNVAANMRKFRFSSRLKKVVLTMIAQNLKDSDLEELRSVFIALDRNKDGTLSKQELVEGLKKANVPMPDDFGHVLDSLDTDGSGSIDYSEFLASTLTRKQYLKEEAAWAAFRMFDKDGDGQITKEELAHVLEDKDLQISADIMQEVDTDASGTISFEEFKHMLSQDMLTK